MFIQIASESWVESKSVQSVERANGRLDLMLVGGAKVPVFEEVFINRTLEYLQLKKVNGLAFYELPDGPAMLARIENETALKLQAIDNYEQLKKDLDEVATELQAKAKINGMTFMQVARFLITQNDILHAENAELKKQNAHIS